jgi:hypothetical protein
MTRPLPRRLALLLTASLALGAAASVALPAQAAWGWNSHQIEGNGRIRTETRTVAGFHGVSLSLPGTVELRIGNSEAITVETDDNLLPLIQTSVEDGVLNIRSSERNANLSSRRMRFIVQARSIDRLALGGSGDINADVLRGPRVALDLGGSGNINVRSVETQDLSVDLGGSGDVKIGGGRTDKLAVAIAGSGNVTMERVQSRNAKVSIAGSGDAAIGVSDQLEVAIVGSGDVDYYGDPRLSKSVMGSGSANRKGARP